MSIIPSRAFRDIEKLFDNWPFHTRDNTPDNEKGFTPRVDIKQEKNRYLIEAELPGVDEKDIKVELDDGVLSLEAHVQSETDESDEEGKIIRKERHYGTFYRSFYVGENVKESATKASFKNGVLKITLPVSEPKSADRKRIVIN